MKKYLPCLAKWFFEFFLFLLIIINIYLNYQSLSLDEKGVIMKKMKVSNLSDVIKYKNILNKK
jgi:hypothetical protein